MLEFTWFTVLQFRVLALFPYFLKIIFSRFVVISEKYEIQDGALSEFMRSKLRKLKRDCMKIYTVQCKSYGSW